MHELFEEQAVRTPQSVAAISRDESVTYAELNERANRLARHIRGRGIGPEDRVVVLLPRSVDLMVALLAVLKTGAAYVPIDPDYPAERIAFMTQNAGPAMILDRLPETDGRSAANLTDADRTASLRPGHACYVVYTSGSTGRPKGVVIEHRSFTAHVRRSAAEYPGIPGTSLVHTSVGFDLTVTALYPQLITGGSVWLGELTAKGVRSAPRPTFLKATPSHLGLLLDTLPDSVSPSMCLMLGGEALDGVSVAAWRAQHPNAAVYNSYGPAEVTVNCCDYALEPEDPTPLSSVPIGQPFPGVTAYLLDERLRPVAPGETGELYVSGWGLARGYLDQPGLTATRFVADPFGEPGARMYRTGDLARRTDQGVLEFAGRADEQLSVRGYRIEPGEIESVLKERPDVRHAAVTLHQTGPDDKRIVCYVVPENGAHLEPQTLRREVGLMLPEYMVPSAFVVLDQMPLSANGKLDRTALPALAPTGTGRGGTPQSMGEQVLCDAFAEVLGASHVGPDDSFVELGGHSLLAIRIINRVSSELGTRLDIRDLFDHQTPAALAGRLHQTSEAARPPLRPMPRPELIPLSFAQERLWFLHRLEGPSPTYNIPYVQRLTGPLDVQALDAALTDVITRHEILRTSYPEVDGQATQFVHPPDAATPVLKVEDVDETALPDRVREITLRPFNLRSEIPLQATLLRITPTDHVLALVIHHISCDGWPLGPIASDLDQAYQARAQRTSPDWAPLPVQYIDYTLWQRHHEVRDHHLDHWVTTLAGLPDELPLPCDRPRSPTSTNRAQRIPLHIPAHTHNQLTQVARATSATTFVFCHAAVTALISKLTGHTDIPIGTPVTGRTDQVLDDLIGFFVNTLVLRTKITGNPSFRELLTQIRDVDLTAFAHKTTPFEHIVERLNPHRTPNRTPLFQIILTAQPMDTPLNLTGLISYSYPQVPRVSKFDLNINFDEQFADDGQPAGITGYLEFDPDLFDLATAESMSRWLTAVLVAAAEDPDLRLSEFDVLTSEERAQILTEWNDTARDNLPSTLPALFEAQVARAPDAAAVQAGDVTLSYAELNARANQLARYLVFHGAGPESIVALHLRRSIDWVVAVWGTLKAGAAYMPIDPEYPEQRIAFILADAEPDFVLTEIPDVEQLSVDNLTDAERRAPLRPEHPCLVVYTSGSTGRPKGITLHGSGMSNLVNWWTHDKL
ncbi:amino acid adenylation domain-containing protein [Streptomyces johnsoniae]|uniref:Amino acid adenylation domain-containing protein n=1 Tax=Streptomyces johnsoniae TaxID=3075532 RepID=A0ABU2S6I8_9ACTN|nr:amino acid adenylation domain-containing protein [Streptomyces sp. DSM 41886]MDT0443459.1 amino acid adenylation domain-containing protein [Streptomyces sp. DSM 41886]